MTEFRISEFSKRINITYLPVFKQAAQTIHKTTMFHGIHVTIMHIEDFFQMKPAKLANASKTKILFHNIRVFLIISSGLSR